jgi:hypothetical protein
MTSNRVTTFLEQSIQKAIEKTTADQLVELNTMRGAMTQRIFLRGQNSAGQAIGSYSTKAMLVGGKSFSSLKGQAKSSKAINKIFATKAARKKQKWVHVKGKNLVVLEQGYKEYRELLGRKTDKVNLDLTGDLRGSLIVGKTKAGTLALGIRDLKNKKKRQSIELKFGRVFTPTDQEVASFNRRMSEHLKRNFNTVINAA